MPLYPKEILAEIRHRSDIVDVVSDYVTLKKVGKNYQALCPFHSETAPSFIVNKEKQLFYCFGCQKGGDVVTFLREINTISFAEAVKILADKQGVSLPSSANNERSDNQKEVLITINQTAATHYHQILVDRPEGKAGREYLKKRGISGALWETFKLGYAPDSWHGLTTFLTSRRMPLELAQRLGLVSSKTDCRFFDCFRGRIIFPIFDLAGNIIGFGGRAITDGTPKYINSSDSAVYKKSYSLFGVPITRDAIRSEDRVLIVEGYFDLLTLYQSEIRSVVAPLGTSLTTGHIKTLKRYTSNFYVVFDADEAGGKAALRSLELFLSEGLSPRVVILSPGSDPDEAVRELGAGPFMQKVMQAPLLLEYYIDEAMRNNDVSGSAGKINVLTNVMPVIDRISEPIMQDECVRRLSEKLDLREERVRNFRKISSPTTHPVIALQIDEDRREEFLLALMLQYPDLIPTIGKVGVIEDFESNLLKQIARVILETFLKEGTSGLTWLLDKLGEDQRPLVASLSVRGENVGDVTDSVRDCICQIKRNKMRKMQLQLTHKIKKAQEEQDDVEIRELHRQKIQLIHQQKNLVSTISSLLNV